MLFRNKHQRNVMNIPKKFHRIWLKGSKPMPEVCDHYWKTLEDVYPEYEQQTWDGTEFDLPSDHAFHIAPNFGAKSDIFRVEVLNREGGIYVDVDIEAWTNIESVIQHFDAFCFTGYNAVIGSTPDHPALQELLNRFKRDIEIIADLNEQDATLVDVRPICKLASDKKGESPRHHLTMSITGPDVIADVLARRPDSVALPRMMIDSAKGYFFHHWMNLWQPVPYHKSIDWVDAAERIGYGIVQAGLAIINVGNTEPSVSTSRQKVCESNKCGQYKPCYPGASLMCCGKLLDAFKKDSEACGCVIRLKTKRAKEVCPMKLW